MTGHRLNGTAFFPFLSNKGSETARARRRKRERKRGEKVKKNIKEKKFEEKIEKKKVDRIAPIQLFR